MVWYAFMNSDVLAFWNTDTVARLPFIIPV